MGIKSVTNDNVADYVKDRKALGSDIKTPEEVAKVDKSIAGKEVKPADQAPPPVAEPAKEKGKNSVQERIDELTRKAKEADEFAEDTYEQLTSAQRRIKELEQTHVSNIPPKVEEVPEPKPTDKVYLKEDGSVDQDKFLTAWGKWNRDKAIAEFKATEEKERQEAATKQLFQEAESRRQASVEAARKEYSDFDEKIEEARKSVEMQKRPSPNQAVQSLLLESDYGAHILYHLTQHPEDVDKWNKMRPSQVAIAIGRLETTFTKPVETPVTGTPAPKSNLPEPTPSLGAGAGAVLADISGPIPFKDYREKRKAELAKRRK